MKVGSVQLRVRVECPKCQEKHEIWVPAGEIPTTCETCGFQFRVDLAALASVEWTVGEGVKEIDFEFDGEEGSN